MNGLSYILSINQYSDIDYFFSIKTEVDKQRNYSDKDFARAVSREWKQHDGLEYKIPRGLHTMAASKKTKMFLIKSNISGTFSDVELKI